MVTEKQILQSVTSITKYDSLLLQSAMVCCYIVRQLFNDKVRQLFSYKEWQVLLESVKSVFVNWTREMVSFELGKEIEKLVFRLVTSVGQRKILWVSMRNWTSDLQFPSSNAQSLSDRNSMVREIHYEVYIWHASCILPGSGCYWKVWWLLLQSVTNVITKCHKCYYKIWQVLPSATGFIIISWASADRWQTRWPG